MQEIGPIEPIVPQTFHQLGILVLDGSGSMSDPGKDKIPKAQSVNIAVREMLTRFIASRNKKDFSFSIIAFDNSVSEVLLPTRVYDDQGNSIDDNADYNPLNGHGGGTDLAKALEKAKAIAEGFIASAPADSVNHTAVIVVLSDGMSQTPVDIIADEIKQNPKIKLAGALFDVPGDNSSEAQKGKELLQRMVSDPMLYKTIYDAETLRKFFIASVSSGKNVKIG